MRDRSYYRERTGARPAALSLEELRGLIASVYEDLETEQYFQEAFGYTCVDSGFVPGRAGQNVENFILRKTLLEGVYPLRAGLASSDETSLFTLVEFLYDYVSKPLEGMHHTWNGCGWHYNKFDRDAGRQRWREELNSVLSRYGDGFDLAEDGEVRLVGPTGLRDVLTANLPTAAGDTNREKVDVAIRRFRDGKATRKQRQDAVRDLADVLEFYRAQVKEHLLKKDESDLFNIANNYAIRHHNGRQKADYDAAWLSWMFYLYLSTIHLVLRLIERQRPT